MSRPMVRIYTEPNIFIDREMNDEEFAQYQIDQADFAARQGKAEAQEAAKLAAKNKLAALGLTTDDLRALGL